MTQPKPIRSSDNPKFKAALRLLSNRGRSKQDRIAVFGSREALRAAQSGIKIDEVFVCTERLSEKDIGLAQTIAGGSPIWELPESLFHRLSYGDRHEGVLAIAQRPATDLDRMDLAKQSLVIVLEAVEKPGNVGAVARTADAIGASALLLADPICDVFHPNCIRASLGSVFRLPVSTGSSTEIRSRLVSGGVAIVAARTDAQLEYTAVDFRQPTAIVLGNEAQGLSDVWRGPDVCDVRLPMRGISDSLNVSVTAAVLMFEAARQRTPQNRPP